MFGAAQQTATVTGLPAFELQATSSTKRRVGGVLRTAKYVSCVSGLSTHERDWLAIKISEQLSLDVTRTSSQSARDAVLSERIVVWWDKYHISSVSGQHFVLSNLLPVADRASLDVRALTRLSAGFTKVCASRTPLLRATLLVCVYFLFSVVQH